MMVRNKIKAKFRIPLLLALPFLPVIFTPLSISQTIYDMSEINGDLRVQGNTENWLNLAAIADFNDSGLNDFIVCSPGQLGEVAVYLDEKISFLLNRLDLIQDVPDIAIVGGFNGSFTISPGDELIVGDYNDDGINDICTSSYTSDQVFCFFGNISWKSGTHINLSIDTADLTISHESGILDYNFGNSLASGDVNQDGIADIIIGEQYGPNYNGGRPGALHVILGRTDFPPFGHIDIHQTPADITVFGQNYADHFGEAISSGDINGDGIDDIVAGAHWANNDEDQCGRVYVFYGSPILPPEHVIDLETTDADIEIKGPHEDSWTGWAVESCDLNGDQIDDICFSTPWIEAQPTKRGSVQVFFGSINFPDHHFIDLATEDADLTLLGEVEEGLLGNSFSSGDMDGDGCDELAISAYRCQGLEQNQGVVYVIGGSPEYPDTCVIDLAQQVPAMKVLGVSPNDEMIELSEMADADMDGLPDLIIGAPGVDREGEPPRDGCGEIYVILSDCAVFNPPRYLAGPGPHQLNPPELRLYDPFDHDGWTDRFSPYLVNGYGLVSAAGDLDGDGYDEIITGPGPGPYHPATVLVLDEQGGRHAAFQAYGTPRFGVNVTSGDLDGDGVHEIVTGAGPGAVYGPHVRGWQWDGGSVVSPMPGVSFLAYGTSRWGVNVACGDIDGDGTDEIVTGAGPGAVFGPHVRGWNVDGGAASPIPGVSFFAYGTLRWGVNVACGDIDGDGIAEIVTGPGPSEMFGSHVRGWNCDGEAAASMPGVNFIAYQGYPHSMGCVVACGDADNDRVAEILTAPGPHPDNPAYVKTWNYDGDELALVPDKSFLVFEEGGYIAGARIALGHPYQPPGYLP